MAVLKLSSEIPLNVVELPISDHLSIQDNYERGNLVILKDIRIQADFHFLAGLNIPGPEDRHKKFVLTAARNFSEAKKRNQTWSFFRTSVFPRQPIARLKFRRQVESVNNQILDIASRAISNYNYVNTPITWKFQKVRGENLHIDNIDGIDDFARLRIFANIAPSVRVWAVSAHLRHWAKRNFEPNEISRFVNSGFEFNGELSKRAFGSSHDMASCLEPRHFVYFEPGEVWMVNSAVTAHQVIYGDRLVIGSFSHSYDEYHNRGERLHDILRELSVG